MEERKVMNLEKTAVFRERVAQMKAGTAEIFQAAAVGSGAGESRGDLGENARIQPKCFDGFRSSFNLRKTIQKKMNIMNIFGK